ncbi:phytanoyl-CoA dioxygenase family protein [Kineosporia babensis]|uniref:Phytanoyl-CoA dioxygenase family protein n=1 Tax=Kineosporia babensis TaxID=499548 RepID=A0A9X1SXY8_9ACTN|nr:phytanoyl-CoA dioxygenase family protein [Kineosporia babensis]MCD5315730.1 phytanoyl-CoA dioxygenase family protein [Kineosporia babensis]
MSIDTSADLRGSMIRDGFAALPGLLGLAHLQQLRAAVGELQARAGTLTASSDDFVLEAAGIGGWAAWQQDQPPLAGVLRSASRIHQHVTAFDDIQQSLGLAEGPVAAVAGTPGRLVNAFLWAKPPLVGSEKPWHQDMAFAPTGFDLDTSSVLTVWIAVEPATTRNGCLQFIPGSHRKGLLPHVGDPERGPGQPAAQQAVEPHVELEGTAVQDQALSLPLAPGSAVLFDGMVLHRSAPNLTASEPRTAVSFVYQVPRPAWTRA